MLFNGRQAFKLGRRLCSGRIPPGQDGGIAPAEQRPRRADFIIGKGFPEKERRRLFLGFAHGAYV